ncbi:hypothetical protein QYM36_001428 [Artemia franciscana]|uniref:Uncharacterized protein n=1 Tax=Artemia franciscana TaxID=6661 RepID=A0AA88INM1_ARTSF|nr:hypothetical protein QYM36_001428 [Artemia franciscana]
MKPLPILFIALLALVTQSYLLRNNVYLDEPAFLVGSSQSGNQGAHRAKAPESENCFVSHNHRLKDAGRYASCAFSWTINYDSNRIPSEVVEAKCDKACKLCGPFHECTQIRARMEVWYKDTKSVMPLDYAIACVCALIGFGEKANHYHKPDSLLDY